MTEEIDNDLLRHEKVEELIEAIVDYSKSNGLTLLEVLQAARSIEFSAANMIMHNVDVGID